MKISSINQNFNRNSFKGLWELKEKDFNCAGLGNVWDIDCVYHPFSDEQVDENLTALESKVPGDFIHQPSPELLRVLYCPTFNLGEKLEVSESEFNENKSGVLSKLGENYSEDITEESILNRFDFESESDKILSELEEFRENMTPEEVENAKKLLADLMKD